MVLSFRGRAPPFQRNSKYVSSDASFNEPIFIEQAAMRFANGKQRFCTSFVLHAIAEAAHNLPTAV